MKLTKLTRKWKIALSISIAAVVATASSAAMAVSCSSSNIGTNVIIDVPKNVYQPSPELVEQGFDKEEFDKLVINNEKYFQEMVQVHNRDNPYNQYTLVDTRVKLEGSLLTQYAKLVKNQGTSSEVINEKYYKIDIIKSDIEFTERYMYKNGNDRVTTRSEKNKEKVDALLEKLQINLNK